MNFNKWLLNDEIDYLGGLIQEDVKSSRYSIEINYRSKQQEVLGAFAKLLLGYISASLKKKDFHIKHVFTEEPYRILVSHRGWEDGEWISGIAYNSNLNTFILAKGFYNTEKRAIIVQEKKKAQGTSASEIAEELLDFLESTKTMEPINIPKPLKRRRI